MKKELTTKELEGLVSFINEAYGGDLPKVCHELNKAVYLLHLVRREEVEEDRIEEASFILHELSQQFYESYKQRA